MEISMDKQYQTRDGRAVRILCVDGLDEEFPVVGYVEGDFRHTFEEWNLNGNPLNRANSAFGLVEVPRTVTHEFWVNVYKNNVSDCCPTQEIADNRASPNRIGPAQKFTVTVEVSSND